MILVLSHPDDDHAAAVLGALRRAEHPAVLIDTALFPNQASITEEIADGSRRYTFSSGRSTIDLGSCGAGWWRRPRPFTLDPRLASDASVFAYTECHEAVAGLWKALGIPWVNSPELDEAAHHKPYQLAVAADVGLPIPRTMITSNPDDARRFIQDIRPSPTIYKTFLASEHCWRETRILQPEEEALLEHVRLAPVIFQEYVPAVADVRVTVFGRRMFATAITAAPGGYAVDYRIDLAGARFEPTTLPDTTARTVRTFMKRLGLVYGALDFRRTPDGRHVFLEVNPAGEWGFVEERTEQPMTETMARLLMELDEKVRQPCR